MMNIGSFLAQSCGGISRRAFLQVGSSLPVAAALSGLGGGRALGAEPMRAKSVIFVWLWGAPSHLDTVDPKPDAPPEFRGPFGAISTALPGVHFSELLPRLAQRSNQMTVIRSHVSTEPGHPDAGTLGLTGFRERPDPVRPSFGAIIAKQRGLRRPLPPYVAIGRGIPCDVVRKIDGYGGGTLTKAYDPFMVSCSDVGRVEIPALDLLDGLNPSRLTDRRTLLTGLSAAQREVESRGGADWDRSFQSAYSLLTSPAARNAFDLSRESEATRGAFGQTTFGQSCLLARRLVEAEVPFIQVNWSQYVEAITPNCDFGWDTHIYNFELLQDRHCPIFDRAFAALLDDLRERGLLDTTLVVAMGEFGRTPRINGKAARDHWPQCYFSLWAGAGLEPGRVIGASDRLGEHPITSAITPLMVGTTIAHLSGLDTQARAEMNVLDGGHVIDELL